MKYRILYITALLVSTFLLLTSRTNWGQRRIIQPISQATRYWSGPDVARSAGLSSDELNNIDIYKSAHLATVNITSTVYRRTIFLEIYPSKDQGSGFLITGDGKILTNSHVVANEHQLEVTLSDQSKYKATLLSRDESNDLALLQITPRKKLPWLRLGDSEGLQVGQKVLAIGNPFGLDGTLTTGVVSSLARTIRGENDQKLEGLIQTDAAINMGNSGGPLLDSAGDVIGINTAILGPNGGNIGIGFAMPINRAKLMLDDLQAGRKRPRLGVSVVPVAGDYADALNLPSQGGLLITEVEPGSAADRAGLHGGSRTVQIGNAQLSVGGDLIMAIDGQPIDRDDAISRALARKHSGDPVELTIFRNGRTMNVRVKLGEAGPV
ncbi:MAG TPA: trypsin-like peptidase domain-containing protein [Bryobacteraceae bacterium]|jgi:S1-C subfamily serine protease|nr:trypsin-like peptidase domain-containing protein [Bryobacteraceae bacterium]